MQHYQNNSCCRFIDERKRPFSFKPLSAAALALLLGACSLAPPEQTPSLAVPEAFRHMPPASAPEGWVNTAQVQPWPGARWWTLWDDPVLDTLMQRMDTGNQTLAQAQASVAQAQALLRQQRAQLLPTIGATGSQQRSGGEDRSATGSASLGLSASWEPDVWGRLADAARAQSANVQASQADLAGARLAAQASLAQAYFSLRALDAEAALLADIISGYERAAAITQNRYNVGLAARTDTLQAQSTLDNARASRAALARERSLSEHAIALLLGQAPAAFSLQAAPWADSVPHVPPGLPATLLLRRPDVAAAERAVAAANARIGVARAAWFPQISLTAGLSAGGGSHLVDVISAPSLLWSLGLSLAQAVFDGGARTAAVDQAIAAHQGATASYRQTALTAFKQVEDQLATLHTLATQIGHLRASAQAAAQIEQQMMNRYQSGLAAYTEVVTAQTSALNARRSLLQLQRQSQQAAISLIQALGGGWRGAGEEDAASSSSARQQVRE